MKEKQIRNLGIVLQLNYALTWYDEFISYLDAVGEDYSTFHTFDNEADPTFSLPSIAKKMKRNLKKILQSFPLSSLYQKLEDNRKKGLFLGQGVTPEERQAWTPSLGDMILNFVNHLVSLAEDWEFGCMSREEAKDTVRQIEQLQEKIRLQSA